MSRAVTPSIRCDRCRYEAEDEGEVMVSMEDVMTYTSETMNFEATCVGVGHSSASITKERRDTHSKCPAIKVI
jgi:hypothetical protein